MATRQLCRCPQSRRPSHGGSAPASCCTLSPPSRPRRCSPWRPCAFKPTFFTAIPTSKLPTLGSPYSNTLTRPRSPSSCALALATVSPMSPRTLQLTHIFRLNENLVAAACRFPNGAAVACTLAVLYAAQRASSLASAAELSYGLALVTIGLFVLVSYWTEGAQKARGAENDFYRRTIKMVYRGNATGDSNDAVERGRSDGGISGSATAAWRPVPTSSGPTDVPESLARRPWRPARSRPSQNGILHPCHSRPFSRPVARAW